MYSYYNPFPYEVQVYPQSERGKSTPKREKRRESAKTSRKKEQRRFPDTVVYKCT